MTSPLGSGTDRDPFVGMRDGRVAVDRIDHDHLRLPAALGFARAGHLPGLSVSGAARDGGIVAEGHVELRIGDFRDVRGRARAVGHREGGRDLSSRIGTVILQITAAEIEQAPPGSAGVDERLLARAVLPIERFVAILLDGLAKLVGDGLEGLVPGDALESAFAALAHALHRILQSIGTVEALAHVAALEAGAQLTHPAAVLHGVVGFDADHGAVLRVRAPFR